MLLMANRTFLTSPPGALPCVARDPEVRLRDIAASRGITERVAYGTVTDLAEAGTWPDRRTDAAAATDPGHTRRCRNPAARSTPPTTSWP
jgi:hypothetical protein